MPSGPPERIEIIERTLFKITISWRPVNCEQQNGDVTNYTVRHRKIASGNNNIQIGEQTGNNEPITITGLYPSTTYLIQVAARNIVGIGVFGNLTASTLPCKFGIPIIQKLPFLYNYTLQLK